MTNIGNIKNEVKSMIGINYGTYNASLKALKNEANEYKEFGNGELVVFNSTNPFDNATKAHNYNGKFSIEDSNTNRTYSCCDDISELHSHKGKKFTTIMMNRGKYQIVIKDNLSDKNNKGIVDGNDTIIIYGDGEEPLEKTVKEFLG